MIEDIPENCIKVKIPNYFMLDIAGLQKAISRPLWLFSLNMGGGHFSPKLPNSITRVTPKLHKLAGKGCSKPSFLN